MRAITSPGVVPIRSASGSAPLLLAIASPILRLYDSRLKERSRMHQKTDDDLITNKQYKPLAILAKDRKRKIKNHPIPTHHVIFR